MKKKLSVVITCKDEEYNIRPCIESVRCIADELLIADSGSSDNTLRIVREMGGCRIIEREYVNAGNFKNWAIPQAKHLWVLVVDADERVTPELASEIQETLGSNPSRDGFRVYRDNYFMGHQIRHTGWGRDKVTRLFRRDRGKYHEHTDHTEVDLPAHRLGTLRHRMTHFTCADFDQYLLKMNRYTQQQADLWYADGKRPSTFRLLTNGPLRFLRGYVFELGFLDGMAGFQVCALTGFYSFMKQARLWQKWHTRPQADLEPIAQPSHDRAA